jgi:heterodisulfide reductase subunit A
VRRVEEKLEVKLPDPIIGEGLVIHTDMVVLSPPIVPQEEVENLAKMLKVPLTEDKFFLEAHVKLRPVDFATEGIFLAGLAHSPKSIEESIAQAKAASARAITIISNPKYETEAIIATVDEDLCSGCGICETVCPYDGVKIVIKEDKRVSEVTAVVCKGCGNCSAACPSGAMQQLGYKRNQLQEMVESAVGRE